MTRGASLRIRHASQWFVGLVSVGLFLAGCSSPSGTASPSANDSSTTTAAHGSGAASSSTTPGRSTGHGSTPSSNGSGSTSPHGSGSSSTTSSTQPAGKQSKNSKAPAIAANTPPCSPATLSAQGGRRRIGSSGLAQGTVVLTNSSTASCFLSGNPTVALLQTNGAPMGVELREAADSALPALLLSPHATANLIVNWANWCGATPGPLQIRITVVGSTTGLIAPFDGPPGTDYVPSCTSASKATTLTVVHAYEKGTSPKALPF